MHTNMNSVSAMGKGPDDGALVPDGARPGGIAAADVDALLHHIVRSTHEVVDHLAERAAPALRRLTAGIPGSSGGVGDGLGDNLGEGAQRLAAGLDDLLVQSRDVVRKHPVAFLAAALAAGIVINRIRAR